MQVDATLLERVRARLIRSGASATPSRVAEALRDEGLVLGDSTLMALWPSSGRNSQARDRWRD